MVMVVWVHTLGGLCKPGSKLGEFVEDAWQMPVLTSHSDSIPCLCGSA